MSTVDHEAEEETPANLPMMFTLTAHDEGRASGRLFLGSAATAPVHDPGRGPAPGDITNELSLLHSRALIMRAVWEAGLNVSVTSRGSARPAVAVVRAELPQTTEEPQRFRLRFQTDSNYELWSHRGRLGGGILGVPFDTEMVRLVVNPLPGRQPDSGADYEVLVSPLEDVLDEARQALRLTIQTDAESEDEARTVELEFRDDVPHRAASFLRQLVLAYVEERHGWTAPPPPSGGSGLALRPGSLSSGAPAYDTFQRDYGRGAVASAPQMPSMEELEARPARVSMLHLCLGAIAIGLVAAAITRAGNSDSEAEDETIESAAIAPAASNSEPATNAEPAVPPAISSPVQARAPEAPAVEAPPQPPTEPAQSSEVVPPPNSPTNERAAADQVMQPTPSPAAPTQEAPKPAAAPAPRNERPVLARPRPAGAIEAPAVPPEAPRQEVPVRRDPHFTRFQAGPYDLPTNPY